jgi:hypothetical protein
MKNIHYRIGYDVEQAEDILNEIVNKKEEEACNKWNLLIFDDFNDQKKNGKYIQLSNDCFSKLRNYHTHMIYVVQQSTMVPTIMRTNCNLRVIFEMYNKFDVESIRHDFESITKKSEDEFNELYKIITDHPHSYMMISDKDVYLYVNDGKNEIKKVDFGEDLNKDNELNRLANEFIIPYTKSSLDLRNHNNIKEKLKKYIIFLTENNKYDIDDIENYLNLKYNIDL